MRRPALRRSTALTAVAGLLLLGVPAGAQDEPGSGFANYDLRANAPGLALEGLYRDVAFTVPEVTSTLTTGGVGSGLASLAWPGPLLGNAGSTLLVLRPDAPSEVTLLDSPVRAQARTGGEREAANTTVPGALMAATADPDEVTARSSFTDLQLPLGGAAGVRSSSRVAFDGPAKAVVEATSAVTDLVLADGAITIGSVLSAARATTDGRTSSGGGGTTVSGVEVAGIPVVVDGKGVRLAGTTAPVPLQQDALDAALAALGLQMVLTQPRTVTQGATTSYDAGALAMVYTQGEDTYALTLGRASVDVSAAAGAPLVALPEVAPAPAPAPPTVEVPAVPAAPAEVPAAPLPDVAPVDEPETAALPDAPLPAAEPVAPPVALPTTFVPVAFALAGGVPGLLALVGLALVAAAAAGLLRVPVRVLSPSPSAACPDERSAA